jgi:AbrB family looped-hinge helix DNA binding protein
MPADSAVLDKHGRIIIPADLRRKMGWEAGQRLTVAVGDYGLRVLSPKQAIEGIQEELRKRIPPERGLVDELIRDRREEVRRDDEEYRQSKARRQSHRKTA